MLKEPTIHQIEELLNGFRLQGGTDAEINALAQDIIRDFRPDKIRSTAEIFETEQHPTIKQITDFKNDGENPIGQFTHKYWHRWYVKYPTIFLASFVTIFLIVNAPMYFAQLQPTKTVEKEIVSSSGIVKNQTETSAPLEPGETVPANPTLVVPKLGVTAPILYVNTTDESTVEDNLRNGVVHYYQTADPGKVGNTFLTGHSSNYWWKKGDYNYVFANLDKMEVGDQAKIYYEGNKFLYQVSSKKVVEPTDMTVLTQSIKPTLTLMTCTPPGTSWKRLIISLDQISPVYKAPTVQVAKKLSQTPSELPKTISNPWIDWIGKLFNF